MMSSKIIDFDPSRHVHCKNGILNTATREIVVPNNVATFDPKASTPHAWINFLNKTLPVGCHRTLQEWFGYCLVQDTSMQKALVLEGDVYAADTISKCLEWLVDYTFVPFTGLSDTFALSGLLQKRLMVVPIYLNKRRTENETHENGVYKKLASIVCEDILVIRRKNKESIYQKLDARIVLLPRSPEDFIRMRNNKIFMEVIDRRALRMELANFNTDLLRDLLLSDLSGILNWALDGLQRLRSNGKFTECEL